MKLRNKKTGEIIDLSKGNITDVGLGTSIQLQATDRYNKPIWNYNSLADLNAEWEDYEEQGYWWIDGDTDVIFCDETDGFWKEIMNSRKAIGNYFSTKEEAEKAVEKLKAWKRLKDKGFRFEGIKEDWTRLGHTIPFRDGRRYLQFNKAEDNEWIKENWKDLFMLFGGEE